MAAHQLGRRSQAGQRISEPVGDRGRHLADRGQLFGLHQLSLRLAQLLRHLPKGPSQLSYFVPGADRDRVVEIAGTDLRHGAGKLPERTRQPARNQPRAEQPPSQ